MVAGHTKTSMKWEIQNMWELKKKKRTCENFIRAKIAEQCKIKIKD